MLNYFMVPANFAINDSAAMSSLADLVNGDTSNAITQAPHHFELWRLGEINTETGSLTEDKEFLADCSSLIRSGIRRKTSEQRPDSQAGSPVNGSESPSERTSGTTRTDPSAIPRKAPGEAQQGEIQHQSARGGAV